MLSLLLFVPLALAVDPDTTIYVGATASSSGALTGFDISAPTTPVVQADASDVGGDVCGIVLDPINQVIYARDTNAYMIYAFDATDLSRRADLDLSSGSGAGGVLEIDPFRRLLYTHEPAGTVAAWSIDYGASYGTVLDTAAAVSGYGATDENQMVRDPVNQWLYAVPNEGGDRTVRVYDLAGQSFRSFSWGAATSLGIVTASGEGIALDVAGQELLTHESSNTTGMNRYLVSGYGSVSANGAYTSRTGLRLGGNNGAHFVVDPATGSRLLVETDHGAHTVFVYDVDSGARSSYILYYPTGVEYYPLDEAEADDDGDGLWDSVEVGATGLLWAAYDDSDPSTITDPDDPDSDDDGLLDGEEDADHDGRQDAAETDPNNPDSDGDGTNDGADNCPLTANTDQADLDGDGLGDACDGDRDGDGYDSSSSGDADCDDGDSAVNPAASEVCNGVDDDCDGTVDLGALDAATWYLDYDGDGFGDAASTADACSQPSGYLADASDCDDGDGALNPAANEVCNGVDDDCDGTVDLGAADPATWYLDNDGDGFGDAASTADACSQPSGYLADASDCDDSDAAVNPAASELCNGLDDDCDGTADLGASDATTWYQDGDGDGFGDGDVTADACTQPSGYVSDASDCDDGDGALNPAATEVCDGTDNDCDGSSDEDDAADAATWYRDGDGDGFGDAASSTTACTQPAGYLADDTDCDDGDAAVNPAAVEVWYDGVDQDCDGASDHDADRDGYENEDLGGDDCDDEDPTIFPGAEDSWYDGVDQDCDGASDFDADGDGFDSANYGGDDCDDAAADIYPGAPDEPYDGVIHDCDDADEYDADGDGHDALAYGGDDCDDANSAINPAQQEIWYDGVDQDCDGNDDDQDGDGWALADDCDDTDAASYPGAPGLDEECQPLDSGGPDTGLPLDTALPEDGDSGLPADWIKGGGGCACGAHPAPRAGLLLLLAACLAGGLRRRP